jgi:hypothetical protein
MSAPLRAFWGYWWSVARAASRRALGVALGVGSVLGIIGSIVFKGDVSPAMNYYIAWVVLSAFASVLAALLVTAPVRLHEQQQDLIRQLKRPDDEALRRNARERLGELLTRGIAVVYAIEKERPDCLDGLAAFEADVNTCLLRNLDSSYIARVHSRIGLSLPAVPKRLQTSPRGKVLRAGWSRSQTMVVRLQEFIKELA